MDSDFHRQNRHNLVRQLGGGLVVLAGYTGQQAQNDSAHRFVQEANFWYLTGIDWPDWRVIIDGATGSEWLVAPQTSQSAETFDGSLGVDAAREISGIKRILTADEGLAELRRLARKHSVVYTVDNPEYHQHFNFALNPAISQNWRALERIFAKVQDCQRELADLRSIKGKNEVKILSEAIKLTVEAFDGVRKVFSDFKYEYQIEAEFDYRFRRANARHAYTPIVASGANACTLHYEQNSARIGARELVVMDVGARVGGYAADITRTYSQNPTKRQRAVHQAVLEAQQAIIALLAPELPLAEYSTQVDRIMQDALISLGLLKSRDDTDTYRRYFPHAVSHGLGIDVHDSLGSARYLRPGMVLTVEPGIYIPEEGIGVRIEDDILITDSGARNLSRALSADLD